MRLDSYDLKILQILQHNGRITKSSLAEAINLSISPCWERVKRLEEAGIIRGYGALLNPEIITKRAAVMVEISLKQHNREAFQRFEHAMHECPQVTECYATGGGIDYIVKVMAADIDQYQRLIDRWLMADLGIERYFTYIVTKTIKHCDPPLELEEKPA
ncbi:MULTISPECIES: Lrp/AsnC family transcriptional regulator [Pseudomonas]|jgi:Lrp/AsnC family transcriptional regulator of ectoine degradation|uniref:Transcriptional regulatory protein DoeX n=1 Tax=Pseudomonas marincola TaxID=437900 RepID=A0A653E491_9PSED|nr:MULTISPECIES: Lrp/AsnC family transcriptional regulator [Pseudomonas]MBQ54751.1 Lrp/AsnC family transcriptional regulator [Pseudomonadaceae bacterium]NRH27157.1 Lrp/AsnC family transcriptional regulator [Pseudomonas sp. MS19]OEO23688.1 AsnC family transcriptional regulator [Pseudomonas sp. J237]CAE6893537.1 Transcriptional regulatory protein DoeX [Pseudomonas marincola]HCP53187.1 Lrp/AsnC family transcriptional regulator [Pseudomonas sp.]|tara:strand:- start:545 stop:1021 length:477 start_codon:yes stop_codon:yes gene_type:complete